MWPRVCALADGDVDVLIGKGMTTPFVLNPHKLFRNVRASTSYAATKGGGEATLSEGTSKGLVWVDIDNGALPASAHG